MSSKWKPEQYKDEYQVAVHRWAENKVKHKPISKMAQRSHAAKTTGHSPNFVDLLRKSLGEGKKTKSARKSTAVVTPKKKTPSRRASLH